MGLSALSHMTEDSTARQQETPDGIRTVQGRRPGLSFGSSRIAYMVTYLDVDASPRFAKEVIVDES